MSDTSFLADLEKSIGREIATLEAQQDEADKLARAALRQAEERWRQNHPGQELPGREERESPSKDPHQPAIVASVRASGRFDKPRWDPEYQELKDKADALRRRARHIVQVRTWLAEDPDLARLIDDCIGQQVKAVETRQRTYAIVVATSTSVASLIAGWLLSAISPVSALAHFLPH